MNNFETDSPWRMPSSSGCGGEHEYPFNARHLIFSNHEGLSLNKMCLDLNHDIESVDVSPFLLPVTSVNLTILMYRGTMHLTT